MIDSSRFEQCREATPPAVDSCKNGASRTAKEVGRFLCGVADHVDEHDAGALGLGQVGESPPDGHPPVGQLCEPGGFGGEFISSDHHR